MQNYLKFHKKNHLILKIVRIIKNLINHKEKHQILSTEYHIYIQQPLLQIKLQNVIIKYLYQDKIILVITEMIQTIQIKTKLELFQKLVINHKIYN